MLVKQNKDTVEEFWDWSTLNDLPSISENNNYQAFLGCLRDFLMIEGELRPAPSGRLALQWLLQGALGDTGGVVLAGSFNCSVVGEAIQAAGFSLETFDLASNTGRIDWEAVAARLDPGHRAVIVPHLFGVPTDFRPILETCRRYDTLVIEDCAHTLGGRIGDQIAGSVGDAAIFSFNYDKPLSLGWGGALLVNDSKRIPKFSLPEIETPDAVWERERMRLFIEYLALKRRRIGRDKIFHRVLWRLLPNTFAMPKVGFGALRSALGIWQLEHYGQIMTIRNHYANKVATLAHGYRSWHVETTVTPAWLKQKVMTDPPKRGLDAGKQLRRMGLRAGNFNWSKPLVGDANEIEKPNAKMAARYAIDIPIHQNLQMEELTTICQVMNGHE